jgi:predicted YcjX-like family ATPase
VYLGAPDLAIPRRKTYVYKTHKTGTGAALVISRIADGIWRQVETVQDTVSETFFEPVIRLGVTGLARSGKTVFITSLVANLLDRGRMPGLLAASEGRIEAAFLQPQPDDTVPRFEYEAHLAALTGTKPHWPDSTRAISELRLSLKVRPNGLLSGLQGPRTVHLDIVDYPGEWLLDLGLMERTYEEWAADTLARIADRTSAAAFMGRVEGVDAKAKHDEPLAQELSQIFADYLHAARREGFSDCTPGRFLLPGDLAGSPVLTFAPIPVEGASVRGSLHREMARRFDAYKREVARPFFRDHFARIDRQVVLVDALGAIHQGPRAVEDLRAAMTDTLAAFRPGQNNFLSGLFGGKKVEKILFAATKSDHLHHAQHAKLTAIMEALTRDARDRAQYAGAGTAAMSIASLRATTEATLPHNGETLDVVRGALLDTGKEAAFYPGDLPSDPAHLLNPARQGAEKWLDQDYQVMRFAPAPLNLRPGDGPPHIRLDRAAEFLIGDRL